MNDRSVSELEKYDIEVKATGKGRGVIWCDTQKGLLVLKEYKGDTNKLPLIEKIQEKVSDQITTDALIRNKEGELFTKDSDGTVYILKQQIQGRECGYKTEEEIITSFSTMAKLHNIMESPTDDDLLQLPFRSYVDDIVKHTNECRRVYNYLSRLKKRNEFEKKLYHEYNYYLDKATNIKELSQKSHIQEYKEEVEKKGYFYHGDYQYHNIIKSSDELSIINFEKLGKDSGVRDLSFLFRKISEKTGWSVTLGDKMINAYIKYRNPSENEWKALALCNAYPEKFWKIVNFYYNSKKSWIPDKNLEKLEIFTEQEKCREICVKELFGKYL